MISRSLPYLLLLAAVPACTEGERALNDGKCPTGQTCSDQTPQGLRFEGAAHSGVVIDVRRGATAIGGTQTFELIDVATGKALAVAWKPEVGGAITVVSQTENRLVVKGAASGTANLRIVEPGNGLLHDQISLAAEPVQTIRLISATEVFHRADRRHAWFAGSDVDAAIALTAADRTRLVDESLTIARSDGGAVVRKAWDHVVIAKPAVGVVATTVSAGGLRDQRVEVPVVDKVDAIVVSTMATERPVANGSALYCYEAQSGDADVIGVPWTFQLDGKGLTRTESSQPNCVSFTTGAAGQAVIKVSAGGATYEQQIQIAPAATGARTYVSDGFLGADEDVELELLGDRARDAYFAE